ncbi:photoreceptor ankyrin repeat protein-like [Salvelinus fontinalis]|uniref:photoreceptor ankyrin repeat protein-like n=1 Tax=Salvelinus fontinalis TaxID=8038 RepID=UPI00248695F7|nr:photoreceptor ankyrin repeat protein-like [Salvelinus fontinalis]
MAAVKNSVSEDPLLGKGPDKDASEVSLSGSVLDSGSVLSDDSVLPDYEQEGDSQGTANTLYDACTRNDPLALQKVLERGVTKEEVMAVDHNGWTGLMVACYKGFLDIVQSLYHCPYLDINHQDNDGNTALMIAAQAGHTITVTYILNYYPGADTEIRDCRGFTALIKAAMQGRDDVVCSLVMAGADLNAIDTRKQKCVRDWALKTGRYETLSRLRRLNLRPRAEQFTESYVPEWPELKVLVAKATANKSAGQMITQCIRSTFSFNFPQDPQNNGVLDNMVRITTSIHSPLVATACRPLCPTSPPEVGKRRLAVPELMKKHSEKKLEESSVCHSNGSVSSIIPHIHSAETIATSCCVDTERRGSIISIASTGVRAFMPRNMAHRNSVFPSGCIPKIQIMKSGEPTPKKEKKKKGHKGHLELPIWKYKAEKQEKKEKKKAEKEKEKAKKEKERKKKREK